MTYILPSMTSVCLFFACTPLAIAEELGQVEGNELLNAAVDSMVQQPGLEARIRQRATVFGQLLSGAGLYFQTRDGDQLLVRLEFQLQVADKNVSLLQINDGSTLWIRRDMDRVQTQSYVDLRRIRDSKSSPAATNPAAAGRALAVGGLGQLLRSLAEHFQFSPARPAEVSGVPVWELTGEWKAAQLMELLPEQRERIAGGQQADVTQLPRHLPSTVKLTLGRDQNFPLFPYRIEYGRLHSDPAGLGEPTVRPLVRMELFEVRRTELEPKLFRYSPGDQNVLDQTETYLRHFSRTGPPD